MRRFRCAAVRKRPRRQEWEVVSGYLDYSGNTLRKVSWEDLASVHDYLAGTLVVDA